MYHRFKDKLEDPTWDRTCIVDAEGTVGVFKGFVRDIKEKLDPSRSIVVELIPQQACAEVEVGAALLRLPLVLFYALNGGSCLEHGDIVKSQGGSTFIYGYNHVIDREMLRKIDVLHSTEAIWFDTAEFAAGSLVCVGSVYDSYAMGNLFKHRANDEWVTEAHPVF